jgi:hypothetical protein
MKLEKNNLASFDFTLTQGDIDLTTEFMMLLAEDAKEYFCSDDLRKYGLDSWFQHPEKEIGTYFAKLKVNEVASPVGEVPSEIESNNRRKVDLWRFNWPKWRSIVRSRLVS